MFARMRGDVGWQEGRRAHLLSKSLSQMITLPYLGFFELEFRWIWYKLFFFKGDTDVGKMKLGILLKCKIMKQQHRIPWLHLLPKPRSPEAKEISLYLVFFHFPRHFCVWPSSAWGQARPTYFRLFAFMDYDYNTPKGQEFWIWVSLPIFRKALPSSLFTSWGERIPLQLAVWQ